jgi:trehalose utilization protein
MGTRATIRFKDGDEEYFVYRGHDGYPKNVDADIKEVLAKVKDRWSYGEIGTLVSIFLGSHYVENRRLPYYELTPSFHGDESYRYYIDWNPKTKTYDYYFEYNVVELRYETQNQ